MKLTVNTAFDYGQIVWHRGDTESPGVVTGILSRHKSEPVYLVNWGGEETSHYEFELTDEKPIDGVTTPKE